MSLGDTLDSTLSSLVSGRAYPDVTPGVPVFPLIVYQRVGGTAGWYVEKTMPDHKHARVQVVVWSKSRKEADTIADQVEAAICALNLPTEPYGAPTALYEESLRLYGARQHFGIWYPG